MMMITSPIKHPVTGLRYTGGFVKKKCRKYSGETRLRGRVVDALPVHSILMQEYESKSESEDFRSVGSAQAFLKESILVHVSSVSNRSTPAENPQIASLLEKFETRS